MALEVRATLLDARCVLADAGMGAVESRRELPELVAGLILGGSVAVGIPDPLGRQAEALDATEQRQDADEERKEAGGRDDRDGAERERPEGGDLDGLVGPGGLLDRATARLGPAEDDGAFPHPDEAEVDGNGRLLAVGDLLPEIPAQRWGTRVGRCEGLRVVRVDVGAVREAARPGGWRGLALHALVTLEGVVGERVVED